MHMFHPWLFCKCLDQPCCNDLHGPHYQLSLSCPKIISCCVQNVKQSDFNLPTLGPKLVGFRDEAVNGRGFVLLRGLPVEQWPVEEVAIAYWGLGTYWGKAQPQNRLHHLLGHVKVCSGNQLTSARLLPLRGFYYCCH